MYRLSRTLRDQVVAFVHPAAKTKAELWLGRFILSAKRAALHPLRRLDAGQAQYRRRQIDKTDQPVGCAPAR